MKRVARCSRRTPGAMQRPKPDVIDLYYCTTPNGHKVTMFLEEAALPPM